jgi:transposase
MQHGRARRKVSVIGALAISPRRRRARAYFRILAGASFDGEHVLQFLRELRRTLRAPIALVWDRFRAHIGQPVKGWLEQNRHRIRAELLPAYAPELNPVELIWGHAKTNGLANFAPTEFFDLAMQAHLTVLAIGEDEPLLRSFLRHCPLSFRLT